MMLRVMMDYAQHDDYEDGDGDVWPMINGDERWWTMIAMNGE